MVPICSERILHAGNSRIDWDFLPGFEMVGRLKPGVMPSQALARPKTLAPEIYKETLPRKIRAEDRGSFLGGTFAGAGLMLSTYWKLTSLDAGFNRDGVLLVGIGIPMVRARPYMGRS
jgi:hypothetical protein